MSYIYIYAMVKYDDLISSIYKDPAGYGSIQDTYQDAKKNESSITLAIVTDWFERNIEKKKRLR